MKKIFFYLLMLFSCSINAQMSMPEQCSKVENPITTTSVETNYLPLPDPDLPPNNTETNRSMPWSTFEGRAVYWTYGLAGSPTAWDRAQTATAFSGTAVAGYPQRRVVCKRSEIYDESQTIKKAASDVKADFTQWCDFDAKIHPDARPMGIAIGSSQGGIVLRSLDMENQYKDPLSTPRPSGQLFGGIVTFGTPNKGAMILNNAQKIIDLGNEGFRELAAGPLRILKVSQVVTEVFGVKTYSKIEERVQALLEDTRKKRIKPISNDYKVGAPYITQLDGYNSQLYKVAFYGVETSGKELFKELSSLTVQEPNSFDFFEANDDTKVERAMENIKGVYQDMVTFHKVAAWLSGPLLIYHHVKQRNRYQRGVDWINTVNDKWLHIIGASKVTTTYKPTGDCMCDVYDGSMTLVGTRILSANGGDCSNYNSDPYLWCTDEYVSITTATIEGNDGVVPVSSQKGFNGATTALMDGSNHQQMRNDKNTRDRLIELFDGNHGDFFKTARK
jgi:hypothetical protein